MLTHWKTVLRTNFTSLSQLSEFLELKEEERQMLLQNPDFILNVPRRLAEKMQKGTLDDPIARQFLPHISEQEESEVDYAEDPNQEKLYQLAPKMLKKYHGRVLLLPTNACAMHCRYCFRQNFPYETLNKALESELEAIANDDTVSEVILSGGDPLSLSDHILEALLEALAKIPHVRVIRFHTRFPIGIPERIDNSLALLLQNFSKQIIFVLHINHPKELDEDVLEALKRLKNLGIPLLCQSVLLKGVNDCENTLTTLYKKLIAHGIIPYYLHQLDRVRGSSRFEVDPKRGLELIAGLQKRLPGYAVPRYVQEVAGASSKTPLSL